MSLFSGAAVLMTSVTGGCFSVAADQTEAEQMYVSTEARFYEGVTESLSLKEGVHNETSGTEGQFGGGTQTASESGTENHSETVTEQGSEKDTESGTQHSQTEDELNQSESVSERAANEIESSNMENSLFMLSTILAVFQTLRYEAKENSR